VPLDKASRGGNLLSIRPVFWVESRNGYALITAAGDKSRRGDPRLSRYCAANLVSMLNLFLGAQRLIKIELFASASHERVLQNCCPKRAADRLWTGRFICRRLWRAHAQEKAPDSASTHGPLLTPFCAEDSDFSAAAATTSACHIRRFLVPQTSHSARTSCITCRMRKKKSLP